MSDRTFRDELAEAIRTRARSMEAHPVLAADAVLASESMQAIRKALLVAAEGDWFKYDYLMLSGEVPDSVLRWLGIEPLDGDGDGDGDGEGSNP